MFSLELELQFCYVSYLKLQAAKRNFRRISQKDQPTWRLK